MKHCIMMTFILPEDCQDPFIQEISQLKSFWEEQGYSFSLYKDMSVKGKFVQYFLTDHSVDDFSKLIQENEKARAAIGTLKNRADKVIITVLDQIV